MLLNLAVACLLLTSSAWAQQKASVEITSEPNHHRLLDNMFVRVYAVTVNPKASTLMHHRGHDYLTVALGNSEIQNIKEGSQPATVRFKDGDVRFATAGLVHAIANKGDTAFRNVTIELLQPTTNQKACTESCAIPVPCGSTDKARCPSVTKIMTSDQWSVTEVVMPPGSTYPRHTHLANFVVVPLTDADVKMRDQDGPETEAHHKAGEVRWNNPIVHTVVNAGSQPTKVVVLEFRGRPSGEGSESMAPPGEKSDGRTPHDHHR